MMNSNLARLALSAVLALAPAGMTAERAHAVEPGTVELTFQVGERRGAIMVALFDSEAGYDKNAPAHATRVPVGEAPLKAIFPGLRPGRYAAKSFHDVDSDGAMNANMFGIPTEPIGFSNNAPPRFGPAPWQAAAFEVGVEGAAQTITLR